MGIKKYFLGNDIDLMPDVAFHMMAFTYRIHDLFTTRSKKIDQLDLANRDVVLDFGCGPGRYTRILSGKVGPDGKIYAVDIQPQAIRYVNKIIRKKNLTNVIPLVTNGYSCDIKDNTADKILAIDMFHMVSDPDTFLKELHRLIKKDGILYLEDGHQPRAKAMQKVLKTGLWEIVSETRDHMVCRPRE